MRKGIELKFSVRATELFLKTCRSVSIPLPKQETLSRHSFLGPNGFRGQWSGPSAEIKVKVLAASLVWSLHM